MDGPAALRSRHIQLINLAPSRLRSVASLARECYEPQAALQADAPVSSMTGDVARSGILPEGCPSG
jgi:hypothetical protein